MGLLGLALTWAQLVSYTEMEEEVRSKGRGVLVQAGWGGRWVLLCL